ncbi:MAG: Kelch repeat-containing protein [Planctomycetota bacterium]|jgi:hypothetical protein
MIPSPWKTLALFLVLLGLLVLPGCGLVWWGAAGAGGYLLYDSMSDEDEETPPGPPVIEAISVTQGEEIGGQTITVDGEGFKSGCRLYFGAVEAASLTFIHGWLLQAVTPPYPTGPAGTVTVDLRVENPDGQSGTMANAFIYVDTLAPAGVTDLSVTPQSGNDVAVKFTAVGDNGVLGTASSYDLRYSASVIDEANFGSATPLNWVPAPAAAGSAESEQFTLTSMDNWYFALKVTDDASNVSVLSNVFVFDPFPPGAARGFRAFPGSVRGRVLLEWRTSADDGYTASSGDVTAYQVRYGRKPILDDTAFDAAREPDAVGAPWVPAAPDAWESFEVTLPEFQEGDKYYFALKIEDDVGNLSLLSTCVAEAVYAHDWLYSDGRGVAGGGLPPGRRSASVVYDPKYRRLISYGGLGGTTRNDVLALDLKGHGNGVWRDITPGAGMGGPPAARHSAAAVWDSANQRMVIFGGYVGISSTNTVFSLDFSAGRNPVWQDITPGIGPSPNARYASAAVYDPYQKRMIVIGGRNNGNQFADVWALDLRPSAVPGWTQLTNFSGPAFSTPRWGAAAVFNTRRNQIFLFGGHNGLLLANRVSLSDSWILDFSNPANDGNWSQVTPGAGAPNPGARGEAACAYDPNTGRFVLAHGLFYSGLLDFPWSDVWVGKMLGNTCRWAPLRMQNVPALWGTGGCFDAAHQRLVVYGGASDVAGNNVNQNAMSYRLTSLEVESGFRDPQPPGMIPPPPARRHKQAAAFDWRTSNILLYGGRGNTGSRSDLHAFSISANTWQVPTMGGVTVPGNREGHAMVTNPDDGVVHLFGGTDGNLFFNDIFTLAWTGSSYDWTLLPAAVNPVGREGAAVCYDALNRRIIVYGGNNASVLSDLLAYDLGTGWSTLSPGGAAPPGLTYACALYDPDEHRMVLFGGEDGASQLHDEVWLLDLRDPGSEQWFRADTSTVLPAPRKGCGGYWDGGNHRAVFFGGEGMGAPTPYYQDTWALHLNGHRGGAVWVQLSPAGATPPSRSHYSLTYDPFNLRAIGFGGRTSGASADHGDTFELIAPLGDPPPFCRNLSILGNPPAREGHSADIDHPDDEMLVFGGYTGSAYLQDLWALKGATRRIPLGWTLQNVVGAGSPPMRAGHGAFLMPNAQATTLIIVGGTDGTQYFMDVWAFVKTGLDTWNSVNLTLGVAGPGPSTGRAYFSCGLDRANNRFLIVGGEIAPNTYTDEVWALDWSSGWAWTQVNPGYIGPQAPRGRKRAGVVLAESTHLSQFGGENGGGRLNDLHILFSAPPLDTWTPLPDDGTLPTARAGMAAFARPGIHGGFFYGGEDGSLLSELWSYRTSGSTTGRFAPMAMDWDTPTARDGASVVWDEENQRAIVFGGRTGPATRTNTVFTLNFYDQPGR